MKLLGLLLSDAETAELEQALKSEPGLTLNLLRLTNSVGCGCRENISSLNHAIVVLGRRQLQRWMQLLLFASGGRNGTRNPLLMLAATRGRLMELLATELQPKDSAFSDKAFMVGIMSLMPALIGLPIQHIIAPLSLSSDVNAALSNGEGTLGNLLKLAEASENGDLHQLTAAFSALGSLGPKALNRTQTQALQWANSITESRA